VNDSNNFLSRWSRRKREASLQPAQPKETDTAETSVTPAREGELRPDSGASTAPSIPEFDVSTLPPIESIDANTNISAFMQKGVPAALRHAALRRAWSADPAIRDFMGPTENYWDAAGPEGIPGFGDLDPNLDVKRLVSELFGDAAPAKDVSETPQSVGASDPSGQISEGSDSSQNAARVPGEKDDNVSHRTQHVAVQKQPAPTAPAQRIARRHGSAMPE
jgi:Protein of unknown function (DUF3306)